MRIDRMGLSMFRIESEQGRVLLTDPWISGNPTLVRSFMTPKSLSQIDVLVVTHGHLDHAPGVPDIKKVHPGAAVVCPYELGSFFRSQGMEHVHQLNMGGTIVFEGVRITMVSAAHSASYGLDRTYVGSASGVIITLETGYRVYYAGDTGLMADMKYVVRNYFKPDLAILPISGIFTMDCEQAAYAAGELIQARRVIPCHWFPNPEESPDPKEMAEFWKNMPHITPAVGDRGKEFKSIMDERYPHIETVVLELGEGINIRTTYPERAVLAVGSK
jgi:L-ascorbate metabolism protein UlaG (beta-lactamase superfamily)